MNTKNIGDIGESVAITEFIKRGISVYLPFGENNKADLIADFNGKLNKILVKTSLKFEDNKITWRLVSNTTTGCHRYTSLEIDYFALYNTLTELLLLVPIEILLGKAQVTFHIPYKETTNLYKLLNYQDYLFDKIIQC